MSTSSWRHWLIPGPSPVPKARVRWQRRSAMLWERCESRLLLDGTPTNVSIGNVTVQQADSGTTNANFLVTLAQPDPNEAVSVDFQTADATAKANADYTPESGTLTFPAGATQETIAVPIIGGTTYRGNRVFLVNLSNPTPSSSLSIYEGQAIGTVLASRPAGYYELSEPSYSVQSTDSLATITVLRENGTSSDVSVDYTTADGGTAVAGVDYVPTSGTLHFGLNQTSQSFTIPLLAGASGSGDKTIKIELSNPQGGALIGSQSNAIVQIVHQGDSAPSTPSPVPVTATVTATATPTVTATATPPVEQPVPIVAPASNALVVTNTNDSGDGSLRQAILTADAQTSPETIAFAIPGSGPFVISPLSALPAITTPVTIDATTQPGYQGTPIVELNGLVAGDLVNGLTITAGSSTVKGLAIDQFQGSGLLLQSNGGNLIQNDDIGIDPTGTKALGNGLDGVAISNSPGNTIGGTSPGARNLIGGNGLVGVRIDGAPSTRNVVEGNYIGIDTTGGQPLGNVNDGVFVNNASNNTIGGSATTARNVISGNGAVGVQISGASSTGNVVEANLIGTDATGSVGVGNAFDGVFLDGAAGNTIGGASPLLGNLISGNGYTGLRIAGAGASANQVLGNRIGTDLSGAIGLGNRYDGVFVDGAPGNTIGGTAPNAGNLISANGSVGVQIDGGTASGNLLENNFIGTDATGTNALGNARDGVFLDAAPGNTVGGAAAGARNLISGNGSVGVQLYQNAATNNLVQNNLIGTDITGLPRLGNTYGLYVNAAPGNSIVGNTIAGNKRGNDLGQSSSTPPRVVRAATVSNGQETTAVVVTFSRDMESDRVQNPGNYSLHFVGGGAANIPIAAAVYDPISQSVTLQLPTPVNSLVPLQLKINGRTSKGLTDTSGHRLDGAGTGQPGSNDTVVLGPDSAVQDQSQPGGYVNSKGINPSRVLG